MRPAMRTALGILVAISGVVLAVVLVGGFPTAAPPPATVVAFDPKLAVSPARALPEKSIKEAVAATTIPMAEVCDAPERGVFLAPVRLASDASESLLVWCRGGYTLVGVQGLGTALRLAQLAVLTSRADLPGGAAAGDFDGDGMGDLALGVAPKLPVVHRAGSGVFWLRGRVGGGFEQPRPLVEAPTIAMVAQKRSTAPGHELIVLTRGEPAAQRPGELWVFNTAAAPTRRFVVPGVVDARDLIWVPRGEGVGDAWLLAGEPGALIRVRIAPDGERGDARRTLPLRGAQGFVSTASTTQLVVRDGASLWSLAIATEEPEITPYARDVRVGPGSAIDLDGDQKLSVLSVLPQGAAVVAEGGEVQELALPPGLSVLAVTGLRDTAGKTHPVLLARSADAADRLLLVFPAPVFVRDAPRIEVRRVPLEAPALPVSLTLE